MLIERMWIYMEHHVDNTYSDVMRIMLRHLHKTKGMNQEQLAELCHTSVSTISRLARALGYGSFSEFRCELNAVAESAARRPATLTDENVAQLIFEDVEHLQQQLTLVLEEIKAEKINAIAGMIHKADVVHLYLADTPQGHILLLDLLHAGIFARMVSNSEDEMQDAVRLTPHDLVILVAGRTDRTSTKNETIARVRKAGAKLVIISIGLTAGRPGEIVINLPICPAQVNIFLIDEVLKLIGQATLYPF